MKAKSSRCPERAESPARSKPKHLIFARRSVQKPAPATSGLRCLSAGLLDHLLKNRFESRFWRDDVALIPVIWHPFDGRPALRQHKADQQPLESRRMASMSAEKILRDESRAGNQYSTSKIESMVCMKMKSAQCNSRCSYGAREEWHRTLGHLQKGLQLLDDPRSPSGTEDANIPELSAVYRE